MSMRFNNCSFPFQFKVLKTMKCVAMHQNDVGFFCRLCFSSDQEKDPWEWHGALSGEGQVGY